ncbi:fatty acid desaturase [uncultured Sphingomonas sp.]|uniref:fatty acid desaturase n=1 Tax=uncultured Sphingomonas sp. TaxID=158754 RepID=UPI0025FA69DC|nr:fatty acid desaturase [uncultured Sphingomonas sp.]
MARAGRAMTSAARDAGANLLLAAAIGSAWLAIHIGCIFLWEWRVQTAPIAVALIVAQTWLSTGLFIIAHDCMHGSFGPRWPRLNTLVGTLCLAAYAGLSYRVLYPKHHAHHRAPGTEDDPDFHPTEPRRAWPWFVRFFTGYYTHAQILRITAAAIVYMLLGVSLLNIVAFWAVPALLALGQLFVFGTYLPHRHEDAAFVDGHHARSNGWSPLASLLTCFHFGAYHHEHHLSPHMPWWQLPRVRARSQAQR